MLGMWPTTRRGLPPGCNQNRPSRLNLAGKPSVQWRFVDQIYSLAEPDPAVLNPGRLGKIQLRHYPLD
jgi:hypothetical protein